jgi:hypothetical protein
MPDVTAVWVQYIVVSGKCMIGYIRSLKISLFSNAVLLSYLQYQLCYFLHIHILPCCNEFLKAGIAEPE